MPSQTMAGFSGLHLSPQLYRKAQVGGSQTRHKAIPCLKNTNARRAGRVAQVQSPVTPKTSEWRGGASSYIFNLKSRNSLSELSHFVCHENQKSGKIQFWFVFCLFSLQATLNNLLWLYIKW